MTDEEIESLLCEWFSGTANSYAADKLAKQAREANRLRELVRRMWTDGEFYDDELLKDILAYLEEPCQQK